MYNKKYHHKLISLIAASFKVVLTSYGGGSAAIPIIHHEFIKRNKFLSQHEFQKATALANTLPGPTIIQLTTYIAYKALGILGGIINFIIIVFSGPFILIIILYIAKQFINQETLTNFGKGVLPAIGAMLVYFCVNTIKEDFKLSLNYFFYITICLTSLILIYLKINIIYIFTTIIITIVCRYKIKNRNN